MRFVPENHTRHAKTVAGQQGIALHTRQVWYWCFSVEG